VESQEASKPPEQAVTCYEEKKANANNPNYPGECGGIVPVKQRNGC